jgi:hypothetical protein
MPVSIYNHKSAMRPSQKEHSIQKYNNTNPTINEVPPLHSVHLSPWLLLILHEITPCPVCIVAHVTTIFLRTWEEARKRHPPDVFVTVAVLDDGVAGYEEETEADCVYVLGTKTERGRINTRREGTY